LNVFEKKHLKINVVNAIRLINSDRLLIRLISESECVWLLSAL